MTQSEIVDSQSIIQFVLCLEIKTFFYRILYGCIYTIIDTYMCGEEDEEKEVLTWNEIPTQGYATVAR